MKKMKTVISYEVWLNSLMGADEVAEALAEVPETALLDQVAEERSPGGYASRRQYVLTFRQESA